MIHIQSIAFFILTLFLSIAWVKIIFCRIKLRNILTIYFITMFRLSEREAYSLLMTFLYHSYGAVVSLALAYWFHLDIVSLFGFSEEILTMMALGAMAELSTTGLFTSLFMRVHPNVNIAYEISKVTWIDGISRLPRRSIPFALVGSSFVEEFFYRGVILSIFIQKFSVSPYLSLLAVTILFTYEQLLFLRTPIQKVIIGTSSISISLIGGFLLFCTGSLIPAIVAHASFITIHFVEMRIYG